MLKKLKNNNINGFKIKNLSEKEIDLSLTIAGGVQDGCGIILVFLVDVELEAQNRRHQGADSQGQEQNAQSPHFPYTIFKL